MLANQKDFTNNGNKVNLAERIKKIRKEKGLSQGELAKKLGIARNTISNWENEICMPSMDNIIAIADVLEISLDEMVGRVNQPKEKIVLEKEYIEKLAEIEEKIQEFTEIIQSEKKRIQESAQ